MNFNLSHAKKKKIITILDITNKVEKDLKHLERMTGVFHASLTAAMCV